MRDCHQVVLSHVQVSMLPVELGCQHLQHVDWPAGAALTACAPCKCKLQYVQYMGGLYMKLRVRQNACDPAGDWGSLSMQHSLIRQVLSCQVVHEPPGLLQRATAGSKAASL